MRTVLHFPDGTQTELVADAPGIKAYRDPNDSHPRFIVDGQRFRVDTVNEFPYVPEPGGEDGMRILMLAPLEAPAN